MVKEGLQPVLLDTCVLLNFLVIDRVDLLTRHPNYEFMLTNHVRGEVTLYSDGQVERLDHAIREGHFDEIVVNAPAELEIFVELSRSAKRLGVGERSAIAAAATREFGLATDDSNARKIAAGFAKIPEIHTTQSLVVSMIKEGLLGVATADTIKAAWTADHCFRLNIGSFGDVL